MFQTLRVHALNSSDVRSDIPGLLVCVSLLAMKTGSATARNTGLLAEHQEPQAVDVTTSSGLSAFIHVSCSRGKNPICSRVAQSRGATMTDQGSPFAPGGFHRPRGCRSSSVGWDVTSWRTTLAKLTAMRPPGASTRKHSRMLGSIRSCQYWPHGSQSS